MARSSDLYPQGRNWRAGAPSRAGSGAGCRTRDGVPRWHWRAGAPEGCRGQSKRGSQADTPSRRWEPVGPAGRSLGTMPEGARTAGTGPSEIIVKRLAALVEAVGRRLASRPTPPDSRLPDRTGSSARTPSCHPAPRPSAGRAEAGGGKSWLHEPPRPRPHLEHGCATCDPARATRHPSPAQGGSLPTATRSSASGQGSRSGTPSPPATRRPPRPLSRPPPAAACDWLKPSQDVERPETCHLARHETPSPDKEAAELSDRRAGGRATETTDTTSAAMIAQSLRRMSSELALAQVIDDMMQNPGPTPRRSPPDARKPQRPRCSRLKLLYLLKFLSIPGIGSLRSNLRGSSSQLSSWR